MSRPIYKEGRISQRERLSLVADLLLEGALRSMESEKKTQTDTKIAAKDARSQPNKKTGLESIRIQTNPMLA